MLELSQNILLVLNWVLIIDNLDRANWYNIESVQFYSILRHYNILLIKNMHMSLNDNSIPYSTDNLDLSVDFPRSTSLSKNRYGNLWEE